MVNSAVLSSLLLFCLAWQRIAAFPKKLGYPKQQVDRHEWMAIQRTFLGKANSDCLEDGFFAIDECSPQYFACVEGELYPQTCPPGGVFDPITSQCKAPEYVTTCKTTTTTASKETTAVTTPTTFNCVEDGTFGFGECQTIYYVCTAGQGSLEQCPNGFVFDLSDKTCKSRVDAGCDDPASTTMSFEVSSLSTTTRATRSTATPAAETDTITPTPTEDNTFTLPSRAPTTTTTPTTTKPTTTTEYIFSCPDNNVGFYPITPSSCVSDYYTCVNGEHYLQKCPFTNVFDPAINACTDPEKASCNQKQ